MLLKVMMLGLLYGKPAIDTKHYEGFRTHVYKDSRGIPTIGYGHNLHSGNKLHASILGLDRASLVAGTKGLTKIQAEALYDLDRAEAAAWAAKLFYSFDDQPKVVQDILIDLCFNMGPGKVAKFKKFTSYINSNQYVKAASELKDSAWFKQVGARAKDITKLLGELADE